MMLLEGILAALALGLLLTAFLLLVPPRPSLKLPALWLACYLPLLLARSFLATEPLLAEILLPPALFFLAACLGHTTLLLVTRLLLRRQPSPWPVDLYLPLLGVIYFLAFLVLLAAAGVGVTQLALGVALLIALLVVIGKDPLRQVAAGLSLRVERLFAPEDWIQIGEDRAPLAVGKVVYLGWRTTTLITADGNEVIVPNTRLAGGVVRRFPHQEPWTSRRVTVVCPPDVPPARVREVLDNCLRDCPSVCQEPPPQVFHQGYTEHGIEYAIRFRLKTLEGGEAVDSTVRTLIWYALDRHRIPRALPRQRLSVHVESSETAAQEEAELIARRKRALRQIPLFADLSEDVLAQLALAARDLWYTQGEMVVRQGDEGDELFFLLTGEVAVTVQDGTGPEVEMRRMMPGQFFGELSLLTGARRSATVRAARECEVIALAKQRFGPILEKNADLVASIRRTLETWQADQVSRLELYRASKQSSAPADSLVARFQQNFKLGW